MKKFYYSLMVLAAAVMAVGCAEDFATNDAPQASVDEFIEVVANIECDAETRTTLLDNNGGKVMWSEGDAIGAIAADGTVTECVATSVNGTSATFSVPATTVNAIYPYTTDFVDDHAKNRFGHRFVSNIAFDGSAKVFGDKQDVMVAALENGAFAFKHVCGYIEIKLKGTGTVKHIALRDNTRKWDALSGLAYISFDELPNPTAAFSTGHKAAFNWLYATCDNIELSKSEATSFYFVVPRLSPRRRQTTSSGVALRSHFEEVTCSRSEDRRHRITCFFSATNVTGGASVRDLFPSVIFAITTKWYIDVLTVARTVFALPQHDLKGFERGVGKTFPKVFPTKTARPLTFPLSGRRGAC